MQFIFEKSLDMSFFFLTAKGAVSLCTHKHTANITAMYLYINIYINIYSWMT